MYNHCIKLIDIRTSPLSLSQVMRVIEIVQRNNPDMELFMDSYTYSIVARPRGCKPLTDNRYNKR